MTDNNSHHEEEHEDSKPHAMIGEDGELWFRDTNNEWHRHERVSTGDPEKDRLLEMSMSEVDEILEDPKNPLYEKAKEVSSETARRIAASMRPWGLVHPEVTKQFFGFISDHTAANWFIRLSEESRRGFARGFEMTLPLQLARGWDFSSYRSDDASESELSEDESIASSEVDAIDGDGEVSGVEPVAMPANDAPTIVQVEWAEASARRFDAMVAILDQTRVDNNRSADIANDLSAEANKIAKTARLISWLALGVSALAACAAIFG